MCRGIRRVLGKLNPRPRGQSDPEGRREEGRLGGSILLAQQSKEVSSEPWESTPLCHQRSSGPAFRAEFSHWPGPVWGRSYLSGSWAFVRSLLAAGGL